MKKKIESYQGAAGGWGAVKSVANAVRKQMDIRQDVIAMFDMNKPEGFDCPGCALMNPLMILVKIIKLRWIHILSYDQMVSRKINNQTTRCANSI
ncbi:hypothetical protein ACUOF4_18210, partial [Escherichia coli]